MRTYIHVGVFVCTLCHSSVAQVATNSNLPPYTCGWQAKARSWKKMKAVFFERCLPHMWHVCNAAVYAYTSKSARVFTYLRLFIFYYSCWLSVCLILSFAPAALRLLLFMFLIIMSCSSLCCCCLPSIGNTNAYLHLLLNTHSYAYAYT